MVLKALPLAHFSRALLLKEEMIISIKKNFKMLVKSAQNKLISSEICPENSHKFRSHYWSLFGEVCPLNFTKSADFTTNLSLKIPHNWTFLCDLSEALIIVLYALTSQTLLLTVFFSVKVLLPIQMLTRKAAVTLDPALEQTVTLSHLQRCSSCWVWCDTWCQGLDHLCGC